MSKRRKRKKKYAGAHSQIKRQEVADIKALEGTPSRMTDILLYSIGGLVAVGLTVFGVIYSSHKSPALWWIFLPSLILLAVGICLYWQQRLWKEGAADQPPFVVEVETSLIETTKSLEAALFWLGYRSGYGDTVSPVSVTVFLRIVNRRTIPAMIERYVVEMQTNGGHWNKLARMDARGCTVFVGGSTGLQKVRRMDVSGNGLDYILADRQLQPNETVRGWAFFEIPGDYTIPEKARMRWRIRVRDTAGTAFEYTSDEEVVNANPITPGGSDAVQSKLMHIREWVDISSLHRKYYTEPIK